MTDLLQRLLSVPRPVVLNVLGLVLLLAGFGGALAVCASISWQAMALAVCAIAVFVGWQMAIVDDGQA